MQHKAPPYLQQWPGLVELVVLVMAGIASVFPWLAALWAKPSPPETTPDRGRRT